MVSAPPQWGQQQDRAGGGFRHLDTCTPQQWRQQQWGSSEGGGGAVTRDNRDMCCSTHNLGGHSRVAAAPWVRQMKDTVDPHNCSHTAVAAVARQWAGPSPGPAPPQTGWAARRHCCGAETLPRAGHLATTYHQISPVITCQCQDTRQQQEMLRICCAMCVWNLSVGQLSLYLRRLSSILDST